MKEKNQKKIELIQMKWTEHYLSFTAKAILGGCFSEEEFLENTTKRINKYWESETIRSQCEMIPKKQHEGQFR